MIQLSDHFDYKRLLKYTMPTIIMLIFTSIYGVVDGFFVSNFAGKTEFTGVCIIMPIILILGSVGFMFGTGGSALISKTLGEGDNKKANSTFSLIVYSSIIVGVILTAVGLIFIEPIALALGAEGELLSYSISYGTICFFSLPAYILQFGFQCMFSTAQKPHLGLYVTIAAGISNMVLDALFVAVFHWGVEGAAIATAISECIGGILPLIYFARPNKSLLKLGKTSFDMKIIAKTCTNGSSELMSNISASIVAIFYNAQLLKYAGQDGVAAYGVIMYINMIFLAAFLGYSVGVTPVIGYHHGSDNHKELKNLLRKGLVIIGVFSIAMFILAFILAKPLSLMFVGYDAGLLDMTLHAFKIFAFSFLFAGFSIFGSGFFTALNDGLTSALISFLRTLVFQIAAVMIFPLIWQLDGIWFSIVIAEIFAVLVTIMFFFIKRKKYHL